jgi:hypothetical protein
VPAVACAAVLSIGLLASGGRPVVDVARPVVDGVPPAAEALADAAERAFDEGRFDEAARQASLAHGELTAGPRGSAIEERTRELQMIWGAALVNLGQGGEAAAHFRAALESDPGFVPSADRFAPPMRQRIARIRKELSHAPSVALEVTGTFGSTIYVDGIARGIVPSAIRGTRGTQGWIWLERGGVRSLAHPVTFGSPLAPINIAADASPPQPVTAAGTSEGRIQEARPVAPVSAPIAATVAQPPLVARAPEEAVSSQRDGPSPIVWVALAAVAVGTAVAIGVAVGSSSNPGMAVGIQSAPGHP